MKRHTQNIHPTGTIKTQVSLGEGILCSGDTHELCDIFRINLL
jgi:hypothetical protein